jgi:uncharacterized protein YyaL (SSP411 family)
MSPTTMPNRLAQEPSPYLLQHANNPVDWYPWGEEAFALARARDLPIFLSIGYSTCHWCHVMEHESFENAEIAELLNAQFVPIKVDREERPDVDRVYMTFVQATTGSGGWPMSVWLTPDLKPFYGGTYFPPASRWGRPGFTEILGEIATRWRESRAQLVESADGVLVRLREAQASRRGGGALPDGDLLAAGVREYGQTFDRHHGGFGGAPKFPRPGELLFLLREHARTGDSDARYMVLETLGAMAMGGMRDHVGGGFHRYSVDAEWRVPHFEKMLYDQAQLVLAFLEAGQAAGDPTLRQVAADTLSYVRRELTHADGGFLSAEDADSIAPELADEPGAIKTEGAFYIWGQAEIEQVFGADSDVVRFRYGIEPGGNAPQDPHNEFTKKNLLYVARGIDDVARLSGRSEEEVTAVLDGARLRLFEARCTRPRPHLDDKVLAGWNGLMIAAFARAARVTPLDEAGAATSLDAAVRAAEFLRNRLWDPDRSRLLRRFRDGRSDIDGYSEDYASVVWGLLELFQAGGDPVWLDWARQLQTIQNELFWDDEDGGWFSTTGDDPTVLLRLKEDYDGAEPSASSIAVGNLLILGHLVGGEDAADHASRVERAIRRAVTTPQAARVVPLMAAAASTFLAGATQVVIVGPRDAAGTIALHRVLALHYLPGAVSLVVEPGAHQQAVAERLPWVGAMSAVNDQPTAYVCRDFSCQAPVTDPDAFRAQLSGTTP